LMAFLAFPLKVNYALSARHAGKISEINVESFGAIDKRASELWNQTA